MEEKNKNWSEFIQKNLLDSGFIDGLLLLTLNLDAVYKYGKLDRLPDDQYHKFPKLFDAVYSEEKLNDQLTSGLELKFNDRTCKFVLRELRHTSACGITKRNQFGIVIIALHFGYLIASHSYPITSSVAACLVGDVAKMLSD